MTKTYKGVISHFKNAPDQIQAYFPEFVELVEKYPWQVSVSYIFSKIEYVKRITIYCGIVKLHWCESSLAWKMITEEHMSRGRFKELFKIVFGKDIPKDLLSKLEAGENVRDQIAHGKEWKGAEVRNGLVNTIDFLIEFNEYVYKLAEFKPFGSLKGFKGRAEPLEKSTTRWVLKGMGIPKKNNS